MRVANKKNLLKLEKEKAIKNNIIVLKFIDNNDVFYIHDGNTYSEAEFKAIEPKNSRIVTSEFI